MNVVESDETTYWYVEKIAAAICYVKMDECCWSWNLAAAIWYVKKDECCWKSEETTYLICWEG